MVTACAMTLIGHDNAWEQWRRALAGERMHHAWLLAGKRGLGKVAFAQQAALELVGGESAITGKDHPDIILLEPAPKDEKEEKKRSEGKPYERKRNIAVGQIREMQQRLVTRPTLGDRRAIIVNPADAMEASASNALLKSLEEPPVGTFFLLVAHRPAKLLPTIRSRCRMLRFHPLSDEQVAAALRSEGVAVDDQAVQEAITAAAGSPGLARDFVERDLGRLASAMRQLALGGAPKASAAGGLHEAMGARPDRERIMAALELARSILADQLDTADRATQTAIIAAYGELVQLSSEAPTYNFDTGLLIAQIGSLLASAAPASDRTNV